MKRTVLLAAACVLMATMALAQGGSIGLFADTGGTDCDIVVEYGLLNIYLVHVNASVPVSGSTFRATPPACLDATFLSVTGVVPESFSYGTLENGWDVPYWGCGTTPICFGTMSFFANTNTPDCCYYPVVPHATWGYIRAWDCSSNPLNTTGGTLILNPNLSCMCDVPVRETSWGAIKALYVE